MCRGLAWVCAVVVLVAIPEVARAACAPRDRRALGWPQGTVVHYDVSRLPRSARSAARRAFDEWNSANRRVANGVAFVEGRGPNAIVVRKGRAGRGPAQAHFRMARTGHLRGEATIRIDLDNRRFFDPDEEGYTTAITKTVLHEVGHTMGLDDVDGSPCRQRRGRSVMNGLCETNDLRDAQPETVTACDLDTLRELVNDRRQRTQP